MPNFDQNRYKNKNRIFHERQKGIITHKKRTQKDYIYILHKEPKTSLQLQKDNVIGMCKSWAN